MSSKNSELSEVTEITEVEEITQVQVETEEIVNNAESEPILSKELHAVSSSHLKLPDGELVEEECLGSNPPNAEKNLGGQQLGSSMEEISSVGSCESIVEPQKKRVKVEDNLNITNRPSPKKVTWIRIKAFGGWKVFVDGVALTEAERLTLVQTYGSAAREAERLRCAQASKQN